MRVASFRPVLLRGRTAPDREAPDAGSFVERSANRADHPCDHAAKGGGSAKSTAFRKKNGRALARPLQDFSRERNGPQRIT